MNLLTAPVSEKGYQVTKTSFWAAPVDLEETPELRWPQSVEVYDRMRRQDAQVISVLRAVTLPIRRTAWRIDSSGCRPEVAELVATDLGLPLKGAETVTGRAKHRFSWPEHLRLALLMLPYGHSFFEQTYRVVDGRVRLRKLGWRPPRTISEIVVEADGGLKEIRQHANGIGKDHVIGVDRLVAYVHEREGGNWLGASLLRPAYKAWLLKDRALRIGSQSLDRNGLGIPVYTSSDPGELTGEERKQAQKEERDQGLLLAKGWRAGDNSGVSIPHGAQVKLLGVEGDLPDSDKPVRYYDEQIARAVLAHFLNLGTETGSWALGSTFADFFTLSLQTVALQIADVTNQHVIEDLVDYNFGPDEQAPRLVFDEIGSRHPATAEAIKQLIDCGAVTPDAKLEQFLRTIYGLPLTEGSL